MTSRDQRANSGSVSRASSGSVSLESVIIIPLFFLVVLAIVQASLWLHASSVAQGAAQDAARAGTVVGGSTEEARLTALDILNQRFAGENWQVDTTSGAMRLQVTITGQAPSLIPGVAIPVSQSASLPHEEP